MKEYQILKSDSTKKLKQYSLPLNQLMDLIIDENKGFNEYLWMFEQNTTESALYNQMAVEERTHRDFLLLLLKTLFPNATSEYQKVELTLKSQKIKMNFPFTDVFIEELIKDEEMTSKKYEGYTAINIFFQIMSEQEQKHKENIMLFKEHIYNQKSDSAKSKVSPCYAYFKPLSKTFVAELAKSKYLQQQVVNGSKVENEHIREDLPVEIRKLLTETIAKHHLMESRDYYKFLDVMEKDMNRLKRFHKSHTKPKSYLRGKDAEVATQSAKVCEGLCGVECQMEMPTDTFKRARFGYHLLNFSPMQKKFKEMYPDNWQDRVLCEFNRIYNILVEQYRYDNPTPLRFFTDKTQKDHLPKRLTSKEFETLYGQYQKQKSNSNFVVQLNPKDDGKQCVYIAQITYLKEYGSTETKDVWANQLLVAFSEPEITQRVAERKAEWAESYSDPDNIPEEDFRSKIETLCPEVIFESKEIACR
jgi:hypothetical protein